MKKDRLLKECAEILQRPRVAKWYKENLEHKSQAETINSLLKAVSKDELTITEALSICLIVGLEWDVKFKGVS